MLLHGYGYWGSGAFGGGFPWMGTAMWVALIALAALAVFAAVRIGRSSGRRNDADPKERGLEILTERFARGEIDAETYKSMKDEIEA